MIKINLLPIRQLRKRAKARNQIIGILTGLLCILAAIGLVTYLQLQRVNQFETSVAELKAEIKTYDDELAKIKKLKQDKKELERKTAVIDQLKSDSSLTVHVLDEVANTIDNERMWLLSLNQQGGTLNLNGVALDNQTVAQFMDNLELSPYVNSVDLADSSLKNIAGRDLKSFSLNCAVAQPNTTQVAAQSDK